MTHNKLLTQRVRNRRLPNTNALHSPAANMRPLQDLLTLLRLSRMKNTHHENRHRASATIQITIHNSINKRTQHPTNPRLLRGYNQVSRARSRIKVPTNNASIANDNQGLLRRKLTTNAQQMTRHRNNGHARVYNKRQHTKQPNMHTNIMDKRSTLPKYSSVSI